MSCTVFISWNAVEVCHEKVDQFWANEKLVFPHCIRSDVQRRISCSLSANALCAWQHKSPIEIHAPQANWKTIPSLKIMLMLVFLLFFSLNLGPPGFTVGALWSLLKAGLEPFDTFGWQPAWKLKHIPPLSKLVLAAATLHTHDHTQTRSCCGLAVTWAGW